jgi:hypothetical protein
MVQYRYIYAGCISGEYIRSGIHPGTPWNTWLRLGCPSELPGPPLAQGQVAHFDIDALHAELPVSHEECMRWVSDDFEQAASDVYESIGRPSLTA